MGDGESSKSTKTIAIVVGVVVLLVIAAYLVMNKSKNEKPTLYNNNNTTPAAVNTDKKSNNKTYEEIQAEIREVNHQAMAGEISQKEARDKLADLNKQALQLQLKK